jgi:hypothetical protein
MTADASSAESPLVPAGTAPALEGYFYQLDVSIHIALELVMTRQLTASVVLEPIASKEDLELDLPDEPQLLAQGAELETCRLVVQCKLKNTGPWKAAPLAELLKHGKRRPSAAERLKADERVRYLLITNADLDGAARRLGVTVLGTWPDGASPQKVAEALPGVAVGRVAVLPRLDKETLWGRIKDRLTDRFRVPQAHLEACRKELQDEALQRMRGAGHGHWTRADIDRVIVKHGGFSGQAAALEGYVPPKNFEALRQILAKEHAIILTGPSGTGKTRTAQALIAKLRDDVKGITVSVIRGAPEKIDQEQRRPVVFDIEDPWGRYQSEPEAAAWNDAVQALLASAGPERKFVFTSRSDVLEQSGPKHLRDRFIGRLEAENYGRSERARLFRHRLGRLPARLQKLVVDHWGSSFPDLSTPLEMERYFDALSDGLREDESERGYFQRCLDEAHQGSIERSMLLNVRHRNAYRWAAVLWGLFKAQPAQTFETLPLIQAALTQKDLDFEDGLVPYIDFLVAGHNLRQQGPDLAYQHPRVELGLQEALKEKPQLCARVLLSVLQVLLDLGKDELLPWGLEGAVRLVDAARRVFGVTFRVGASEQVALDAWIRGRLSAPGVNFQDDLRLAASVGSARCVPAEVARWLFNRDTVGKLVLDVGWRPMAVMSEWIDAARADPATHIICEAFIRRMLARDRGHYQKNFAREVRQLSPDLAPAFRDAALDNAEYGYTSNDDAIAYGALEDLDAFEPILTRCLDYLASLRADPFDGEWLALRDGHYSDDATEHLEQSHGEQGHTAGEFVQAYVSERRERTGWTALHDHPRRTDLLYAWIREARNDDKASDAEWHTLADDARRTHRECDFWVEASTHWRPMLAVDASTRLIEGDADEQGRLSLAAVFARHLGADTPRIVEALLRAGPHGVLELACDLAAKRREPDKEAASDAEIVAALERLAAAVPAPLEQAVREAAAIVPITAIHNTLPIWRNLGTRLSRRLRLARARILSSAGDDLTDEVEQLLKPRRDSEAEIRFIEAVFEVASRADLRPLIEAGLTHRFAAVRLQALRTLAAHFPEALPAMLLALAADKSYHVRRGLLELLKAQPHAQHTDAVIVLAGDTWSPDMYWGHQQMQFPIAEGAVEALSRPPVLDAAQGERIMAIALNLESHQLTRALFGALIVNGTASDRDAVLKIALGGDTGLIRKLAAWAFVFHAEHVDPTLLEQVTDAPLIHGPAKAAFALTVLIGMRADPAHASRAARAIAAVPERHALLVPLYLALVDRGASEAQETLSFLPEVLTPALEQAAAGTAPLPPEALTVLTGTTFVSAALVEEIVHLLKLLTPAPSASEGADPPQGTP